MRQSIIWSVVGIVTISIVIGAVYLSTNPETETSTSSIPEITQEDWVKGNTDSEIVFVEYGDFQCPACASYFPIIHQLQENFSDSVKFVYRHYPLRRIHAQADLAARASEAAGNQGKFWEMHDMLYQKQKEWSGEGSAKDIFITYAEDIGLDAEQFQNDIDSKEVSDRVRDDERGGFNGGIQGTPTFFLNGEKIQNPRNYEEFRKLF